MQTLESGELLAVLVSKPKMEKVGLPHSPTFPGKVKTTQHDDAGLISVVTNPVWTSEKGISTYMTGLFNGWIRSWLFLLAMET